MSNKDKQAIALFLREYAVTRFPTGLARGAYKQRERQRPSLKDYNEERSTVYDKLLGEKKKEDKR
jgi:hypothetical protein